MIPNETAQHNHSKTRFTVQPKYVTQLDTRYEYIVHNYLTYSVRPTCKNDKNRIVYDSYIFLTK